jgi:uncharacterized protein (UPF0332 family)
MRAMPLDSALLFLVKADESLAGAEREFAHGAFNNCANRCYYACFQAAIHALMSASIRPSGGRGDWSHAFVQAQFVGQLVNRRKVYPAELRNVLGRNYLLREAADYKGGGVQAVEASRALARTRAFLGAIRGARSEPA